MNDFLLMQGWNLCLCVPMGLLVWCLCRIPHISFRPALCHGLWMIVLLKLVTPPLIFVPVLPAIEKTPIFANSPIVDSVVVAQNTRRMAMELKPVVMTSPPSAEQTRKRFEAASPDDRSSVVDRNNQVTRMNWPAAISFVAIAFSVSVTLALWFVAIQQLRRIHRLIATGPFRSDRVERLLDQLADRMKLKVHPRIVIVDCAVSPVIWAELRNVFVVLPKMLVESLDDDRLRNVIAHELAHFARRDHWTNLFGFIVTTLLWWHPIAWLARRELGLAAESCCDALAVELCGESRKSYAQTLLSVVDFVNSKKLLRPHLGLSFGGTHSIRRRIEMLAKSQINTTVSSGGWAMLISVAMLSLLLPARAQETKPASSRPPTVKPGDNHTNPSAQETKSPVDKIRAEIGKYFVTGSVIDEVTKESIPHAKLNFLVEAEPEQNKRLRRITTDDHGKFRFEVPIGTTRLWFPELRSGYWLEAGSDRRAVATTKDQPVAVLEILVKKGNAWPVHVVVEGGVPENTLPVVSVMEMEDDDTRRKAVNGEQWSLMKSSPRSSSWLTTDGQGGLTQCGTSGKLFVTANITFDPAAKAIDRQEVPGVSVVYAELLVDPGFDVTNVTSATPLAGADKVELLDKNGAKATIAKAKVTVTGGRPLLTFHLSRTKSDMKAQEYVGRVVDAMKKPISNVRVGAVVGVAGGGSGDTGLETTTDQDGRFQIKMPVYESTDGAFVSFVFNKDGFAGMDSRDFPIPKAPSDPIDVGTFTLKAGYSYPIRVMDKLDQPIVGAVIEPMDSYALRRLETRTDGEGLALLQNLPQGVVSINVHHGEESLNRKIVVNPANRKELKLRLESVTQPVVDKPKPAEEKEPLAVGRAAPEFAIDKWTDGKLHQLADYRGRVVLVDFWGVWCGGCVTSIPMLRELEEKYEPKGVAFLGIHTADGELEQIDDLKKLHQWKAISGIDRGTTIGDGETASRYGVRGFPTLMIIDTDGKIAFNSSVPPSEQKVFMDDIQQIARSLAIPWPLPETNNEETISQFNRILAVKMGREIDKVIMASKNAKKPD